MKRPSLIGQLTRAHVLVVAAACTLLVVTTMLGGAVLLRRGQDRTIEAIVVQVANGIDVEAQEEKLSRRDAAIEYFRESEISDFRFELLARDGTLVASDGELPQWRTADWDIPPDARVGAPRARDAVKSSVRFRGCARWCGPDHILRVITEDVLDEASVRRLGGVLLGALPIAVLLGALIGGALFGRRLRPLEQLESAAASASGQTGAALRVDVDARELASLRDAFNGLLARLGESLAREKRFSQQASHELRTPLAALRGRIERLSSAGSLTAAQSEHAATALREVDALDNLVEELLLLARSESAPLPDAPVNLCDLARDVAARQVASDGRAARPPEVDAPDEILVRGSEPLLTRAIANLVENARKFGGPSARIRLRVGRNGSSAMVAVADDGPGIADAERAHVFEPFHRAPDARSRTGGVGLGLAVARAIALRHGGAIELARSDLGGEEFTIALPALK